MPEIFTLLGMLVIVAAVLVLAYLFTRYVASRGLGGYVPSAGRRMRVLDQLPVGRDQRVLLAQVGGRFLLLGATPAGVTLLAELSGEEAALWQEGENGEKTGNPSFREALLAQLKKKR